MNDLKKKKILKYFSEVIDSNNAVLVIGRDTCPYTQKTKRFFEKHFQKEYYRYLDLLSNQNLIYKRFKLTRDEIYIMYPEMINHLFGVKKSGISTVPQVFLRDSILGDSSSIDPSKYQIHSLNIGKDLIKSEEVLACRLLVSLFIKDPNVIENHTISVIEKNRMIISQIMKRGRGSLRRSIVREWLKSVPDIKELHI